MNLMRLLLGAIGGGIVVWGMVTIIQLVWLRLKRPAPPLLTDLVARWAKAHRGEIQRYAAFGGYSPSGPLNLFRACFKNRTLKHYSRNPAESESTCRSFISHRFLNKNFHPTKWSTDAPSSH